MNRRLRPHWTRGWGWGVAALGVAAVAIGLHTSAPDAARADGWLRRAVALDDHAALVRLKTWGALGNRAAELSYAKWSLLLGDATARLSALAELLSWSRQGDAGATTLLVAELTRGRDTSSDARAMLRETLDLGARQHVPDALLRLGRATSAGEFEPPDAGKALDLYLRAADLGNAEAMFLVGNAYRYGIGTTIDLPAAVLWYQRAAESEYPPAIHTLTLAYTYGELGLPVDESMARLLDRELATHQRKLARR